MADVKISQLPSLSTMTDAAIVPVVASATTQQISGANLRSYFNSNGNSSINIATANGNITITANSTATWTFDTASDITIPGNIISANRLAIDNRAASNISDVEIFSAAGVYLQGQDQTLADFTAGGAIGIYAGDGSPDDNATGAGAGGGVTISAGDGGEGNTVAGNAGGSVSISAGDGGNGSATAPAGQGNDVQISAGYAGLNNGGGGAAGGSVTISAGNTSNVAADRGRITLNAGGGGDETSPGGYVEIAITAVGTNPGGSWTFTGKGTVLDVPPNAEIFGFSAGNITLGSFGNAIVRTVATGPITYNWVFSNTGMLTAPGAVVTSPVPFANLTAVSGARAFVSDGNIAAAGNFGAQIAGGGGNTVPVWSDGTNWYVG